MKRGARGAFAVTLFAAGWLGCSSDVPIGSNLHSGLEPGAGASGAGSNSGGSGGSAAGGAAPNGGSAGTTCEPALCQGRVYACGNCIDDDGDGTLDSDDVHCTGPCDDSETSFSVDIPGGNAAPCRHDCFFDGDTGAGNDACAWSHRCDPLAVAPDYPPSGDVMCSYDEDAPIPGMTAGCSDLRDEQDPMCAAACGPLVPNGCDCFGCCELPAASGRYVWLGSGDGSCTLETLDDSDACRPCTPVEACLNPCDGCELCVGRTTLDETCGAGGAPVCPTGMASCGPGIRCPETSYCITGCCVPEPT